MPTRHEPWPLGTPCWADVMSGDIDGAIAFYSALFGWEIEKGAAEMGYYSMASVGGNMAAGLGTGMEGTPPAWTTYLASPDCADTVATAVAAGASVIADTMDVMEFGRMAVLTDPTGGTFGIWQAGTHSGFQYHNAPGGDTWNELMTRDYEGALAFYSTVFGYTPTEIGGGGFQYSTLDLDGRPIGGLGVLPPGVPAEVPAHWRTYFEVEDADAAVEKAVSLGATLTSPPQDMPYGRHADLMDPQGAQFSVITSANPA